MSAEQALKALMKLTIEEENSLVMAVVHAQCAPDHEAPEAMRRAFADRCNARIDRLRAALAGGYEALRQMGADAIVELGGEAAP